MTRPMELVSTLGVASPTLAYAVPFRRSDGAYANSSTKAFEVYNSANWASYAVFANAYLTNASFSNGTFYFRAPYPSWINSTLTSEVWYQTVGDGTPRPTDLPLYIGQSQGAIISTPGRIETPSIGYPAYAVLVNPDGTVANNVSRAFEAFNPANLAAYAVMLAADGNSKLTAAYPAWISTAILTTDMIFGIAGSSPDLNNDVLLGQGGANPGIAYPPYHSQGAVNTSVLPTVLPASSKLSIWQAVLATLQNAQQAGQPLAFVSKVYDGIYVGANDLPPAAYPAIMMELDEDDEQFFTTGVPPALKSAFRIHINCLVREAQPNKGISGDAGQTPPVVGLLAFVDSVKNVLQADQSLNNAPGLQKLYFGKTIFLFEGFPIREAKIACTMDSQLTTTSH